MAFDFCFGEGTTRLHFFVNQEKITYSFPDEFEMEIDGKGSSYILDVEVSGRGTEMHNGVRHIFSYEACSLKYISHEITEGKNFKLLKVTQQNDILKTVTFIKIYNGTDTVRVWSEVKNISEQDINLEYASSFVKIGLFGKNNYKKINYYQSSNGWYCEAQWHIDSLFNNGVFNGNDSKTMKKLARSNSGTQSTKHQLPMGALELDGKFDVANRIKQRLEL